MYEQSPEAVGIVDEKAAARILPEMGIEHSKSKPLLDFRERASAMCETLMELHALGLELPEADSGDENLAEELALAYAEDPHNVSEKIDAAKAATLTPASLLLVQDVLEKFGHVVATDATRIRHLVTNKLLIETDHPDAKVRLRSLELLGKISDVGLFTEKRHITFENVSNDEVRDKLRSKLHKLQRLQQQDNDNAEDAVYEPVTIDNDNDT